MTATPAAGRTRAIFLLLLANVFWGLSFLLIKAVVLAQQRLSPDSGTWFLTAYALFPRFGVAAAILAAGSLPALRRLTRSEWKQSLGLALFAAGGMLLQSDGLQFTSASTSAFLTQFYAIMIPLFLALRARRSPPAVVWASCALVLAGVAVLARLDWHHLRLGRGEIETLVSSVFFMGQILWLERREFAGNRMLPVTTVMCALLAAGFLAMSLATAARPAELLAPWGSAPWVGFTLVLAVFSTIGSYLIMNFCQPKITATEAGLIYCLEPVFASVFALFLPALFSAWAGFHYANETLTGSLLLGGGLVTAANVLIQLRPPAKDSGF